MPIMNPLNPLDPLIKLIKHPFLRSSSRQPNQGNPVNDIKELFTQEINLTKLMRSNGTLSSTKINIINPVIDVNLINLKLSSYMDGENSSESKYGIELITENMTVRQIYETAVPAEWEEVFFAARAEFDYIDMFLVQQEKTAGKFIPMRRDLFNAFYLCPLNKVKVVIIGQDPYHTMNENIPISMGLSFSVRRGTRIPPSLNNIFKEIYRSIPEFEMPSHGDLTKWSQQGVLMLNSCLTVNPHSPGSHCGGPRSTNINQNLWNGFLTHIITAIEQKNPRCIFVLWGSKAQKLQCKMSTKSEKLISSHPSPHSWKRDNTYNNIPAFYGSDHFVLINKQLQKLGHNHIDWNLDIL